VIRFVGKSLVEWLGLSFLIVALAETAAGRVLLLRGWFQRMRTALAPPEPVGRVPRLHQLLAKGDWNRGELLKAFATTPALGGFIFALMKKRGWESHEESRLLAGGRAVRVSSKITETVPSSTLKDLQARMPYGQAGDLKLSRIILGGNLIGGWAHARDLVYVSRLIKSYHTDEKVFDTLQLAEACGINTLLTNPVLCRVINDYWRKRGGRIQFISDCALGSDVTQGIEASIDGGAHACYIQGAVADGLVDGSQLDEIGRGIDLIRRNGLSAGIGAHKLETVQACVEAGFRPDFWVKTLHFRNSSSIHSVPHHGRCWCARPRETIEYMKTLEQPWIAFKTLATGAIHPREGFRYAFENGADFICVGMYDFQIVEDVDTACNILAYPRSARIAPARKKEPATTTVSAPAKAAP
jgi:hypothetical protein